MGMSNQALAQRADFAIADLTTDGGLLQPEQANTFIDLIMEQPTILSQVRSVRMNSPAMKIDKIGFDSRIVHAAPQGTSPFAADDGSNDRWLAAAKRAKPTTQQISLATKEYMAEVHIPYEALEDSIERDRLESHIMTRMAARVAVDSEEIGLFSDTGSGDTDLVLQDGWLKRMTSNVVDNANAGASPDMFEAGMLAMPQRFMRNLASVKHFVTLANTIRYRALVAQRITGYGDSALTTNLPLVAYGVPVEAAPMLAAQGSGNSGFFTFPQNLIWGIQRQISVETMREIRAREVLIVLTFRMALQIETEEATVRYSNI